MGLLKGDFHLLTCSTGRHNGPRTQGGAAESVLRQRGILEARKNHPVLFTKEKHREEPEVLF